MLLASVVFWVNEVYTIVNWANFRLVHARLDSTVFAFRINSSSLMLWQSTKYTQHIQHHRHSFTHTVRHHPNALIFKRFASEMNEFILRPQWYGGCRWILRDTTCSRYGAIRLTSRTMRSETKKKHVHPLFPQWTVLPGMAATLAAYFTNFQ